MTDYLRHSIQLPVPIPKKTPFKSCTRPLVTDVDDLKMSIEKAQRRELLNAHRQFRKLECRSGAIQKCVLNTRSQQPYLPGGKFGFMLLLLKEKEELQNDLAAVNPELCKKLAKRTFKMSQKLVQKYERHVEAVQSQLVKLKEATQGVDKLISLLAKCRLRVRFIFNRQAVLNASQHWENVFTKLENNLYVLTTSFNGTRAKSDHVRKEIQFLLGDRLIFYQKQTKYKKKLAKIKHNIHQIVDKSHLCYELVDEAKIRQRRVLHAEKREIAFHASEVTDQGRKMENDLKVHKFHRIKNRPRSYIEKESCRKKRLILKQAGILDKILRDYAQAFRAIREEAMAMAMRGQINNMSDNKRFQTDRIAHAYLQKEANNYLSFRYNNDLNMEVSQLQQEIRQLQHRLSVDQTEFGRRKKEIRKIQKGWKQKFDKMTEDQIFYAKMLFKTQTQLPLILDGFKLFLKTSQTAPSAIFQLLGYKNHDQAIDVSTLLIALRAIENKMIRLMSLQDRLEAIRAKTTTSHQTMIRTNLFRHKKSEPYHGGLVQPKIHLQTLYLMEKAEEADDEEKFFRKRPLSKSEMMKYCHAKFYGRNQNNSSSSSKLLKTSQQQHRQQQQLLSDEDSSGRSSPAGILLTADSSDDQILDNF